MASARASMSFACQCLLTTPLFFVEGKRSTHRHPQAKIEKLLLPSKNRVATTGVPIYLLLSSSSQKPDGTARHVTRENRRTVSRRKALVDPKRGSGATQVARSDDSQKMDYPPGVVNIADFRIPGNEPKDELDSPLSSAPGSPKESPLRRSEIGAARDWGNKLTIPNIEVLPSFDEGRIMSNRTAEEDVPDDEKKFDGKDELVGKRATCIGEDEPPSLSIRDQPPRLVPKTTQSTTNPMTPIQDLKSPPKVLKQTMWETRNSASKNFVSLSSKEALESSYDQGYASDEAKIPSPFKTKRQGDTMSAEASHPDDESGKSIASAPDDEKTAQKPANSTDVPGESTSSAFNIQESIETTLTGWVSAVFGMSGSNNEPDEEEQPENPPEPELDGDQRTFNHELTNSLKASSPTADNQLTDEKEVVAIREKSSQKDFSDISDSQGFEVELDSRSHGDEAMGKPVPRRLDYGNTTGRSAKILASEELRGHESLHNQSLDVDLKEAMRRFASDTREALRKAGENDANAQVAAKNASNISNSPLRSLTIGGSTGSAMNSDTADTQKTAPVLVQTMDSELGIAKGDIMLSLLNENTKATDTSVEATWADRVHGAIWRCRRMRKSIGCFPSVTSPVPTGINKSQVAKGLKSVAAAQEVALANLAHDEIDEALELFEGIIFAYFSYFEHAQSQQGDKTDIKVYLGAALHNLGILNLLKGEYKEAFSFFTRAVDSRKASLGEGHPDHLVSVGSSRGSVGNWPLTLFLLPLIS